MAVHAAEAFDRVEEPGFAAYGEVKAAVAVGHDVQARCLLRVDDGGNGVEVLLAEQRLAQRRFERPPAQAHVEPQRARIGAGDRGWQYQITGCFQH